MTARHTLRSLIERWQESGQQVLADERGSVVDDDALIAAMCNAVLAGANGDGETAGRAKFQIATVTCPSCDYAAHVCAGIEVPIHKSERERAECDAQRISATARATQDVTPRKRREIFRRDGGKCCVPGCRASRYLEVHHIVSRAAVARTSSQT